MHKPKFKKNEIKKKIIDIDSVIDFRVVQCKLQYRHWYVPPTSQEEFSGKILLWQRSYHYIRAFTRHQGGVKIEPMKGMFIEQMGSIDRAGIITTPHEATLASKLQHSGGVPEKMLTYVKCTKHITLVRVIRLSVAWQPYSDTFN